MKHKLIVKQDGRETVKYEDLTLEQLFTKLHHLQVSCNYNCTITRWFRTTKVQIHRQP